MQLALVGAIAATAALSIFAAQVLLAAALLVFLARLLLGRASFPRLPLDAAILAFTVWSLLSAAFSTNPLIAHENAKKLVLFLLLYLAVDTATVARTRERLVDCLLLGGLVLGAGALAQYYLLGFDTLTNRPRSLLGHYMTASGVCMCAGVLAASRLAFRGAVWPHATGRDWRGLALVLGAVLVLTTCQATGLFPLEAERLLVAGVALTAVVLMLGQNDWPGPATGILLAYVSFGVSTWALLVSRTRSAWLGLVAGLLTVALLRAPRLVWLLVVGLVAVAIARPAPVMDRLTVSDTSSIDRYYMWQAGLDMVIDRPIFGQGPGMVEEVYPHYRWPQAPTPRAPHLHNNIVQIAAERGLPCLGWWLWFISAALGGAVREARRTDLPARRGLRARWVGVATLGVLTALLTAGMFEYNFGDSEVLMFTLLVIALPYALRQERTLAWDRAPDPAPRHLQDTA